MYEWYVVAQVMAYGEVLHHRVSDADRDRALGHAIEMARELYRSSETACVVAYVAESTCPLEDAMRIPGADWCSLPCERVRYVPGLAWCDTVRPL